MYLDKTNLEHYLQCARIPIEAKVLNKVLDLQRLLQLRIPNQVELNKSPGLCPSILIELACRVLEIQFSRENIFQALGLNVSGVGTSKKNSLTINDYRRLLTMVRSTLSLTWSTSNTMSVLAMHYESAELLPKSQEILKIYKERYCALLPETQQQCINTEEAIYQCAALWCAACELKIKADKKMLLDVADVDKSIFQNVCDKMTQCCQEGVEGITPSDPKPTRKRKLTKNEQQEQEEAEKELDDGESAPLTSSSSSASAKRGASLMGVNILSPMLSSKQNHSTAAIHSIGSMDALPTQYQYRGRQKQFAAFLQQQTTTITNTDTITNTVPSSSSSSSHTKQQPVSSNTLTASTASGMVIRKVFTTTTGHSNTLLDMSRQDNKENIPHSSTDTTNDQTTKELCAREKYLQWKKNALLNKDREESKQLSSVS